MASERVSVSTRASATARPSERASSSIGQGGGGSGFTFGTAITTAAPPSSYSNRAHALSPTTYWGSLPAPYETNVWWQNLVISNGEQTLAPNPYQLRAKATGPEICYPGRNVSSGGISTTFLHTMSFQAVETVANRFLTTRDMHHLSVTMRWRVTDSTYMEAPIVKGMPYVTMRYAGLTPQVVTGHAIIGINGQSNTGTYTGSKFKLVLNNGQTWLLYASSAITFACTSASMIATSTFTGTLRLAILADSAHEATYDAYKDAYPTAGSLAIAVAGDTATTTFTWLKGGTGELLMLAYPHHTDILVDPTTVDLPLKCLKGTMTGIVGEAWVMTEALPTITWGAPRGIDPARVAAIQTALNTDKSATSSVPNDPYFGGKEYAKLGRLAIIADELGDTSAAATIRTNAKAAVEPWLNGLNTNHLRYDTTWKGINTNSGMDAASNDFGAGWYNDHHFHWGYHIYTAAAIARGDSAWAATYREKVNTLVRDIMNPSAADTYFTPWRSFDFFEGHSWAHGLTEVADAKNQESTSEAINAWYGVMLWGLAIGDDNIREHARILLAKEIRSTNKYWHMKSADTIYESTFAANKAIGILWATKVDYATFFGTNVEFIHEIQSLPFTPITELYLPADWVTEEYPVVDDALTRPSPALEEGWKGFIYMKHAVLDKAAAWDEVNTLSSFDGGNSKTNALYWVATR